MVTLFQIGWIILGLMGLNAIWLLSVLTLKHSGYFVGHVSAMLLSQLQKSRLLLESKNWNILKIKQYYFYETLQQKTLAA